jgi:hypothetical protein
MPRLFHTTKVPVHRTVSEIIRVLQEHGATSVAVAHVPGAVQLAFTLGGRSVRLDVAQPDDDERECRRRLRVLMMSVKMKLDLIEDDSSTVEDEFMAHLVLPSGETVRQSAGPMLEELPSTLMLPELS